MSQQPVHEAEHVTTMGRRRLFSVEPWCVTENDLDLDEIASSESVFALSNGHIGLRGNLDEGDPHGVPGTYLNSFYELRPLEYGERGYGFSESGQTVINVTDGKIFRLLVDDEPFDVRYGTLDAHRRRLDLRAGTLERTVEWHSPAGDGIRLRTTRLVSLTQRAVAAIEYEVEPIDKSLRIVVQSELVANEDMPDLGPDPRTAAVLERPLVNEEHTASGTEALMVHHTRQSGLRMAAGMRHEVEGPENTHLDIWSSEDVCRLTIATRLRARREAAHRQVPGLRLVEPAHPSRRTRPGGGGPRRRPAHGVGRPVGRAARLPRPVLGGRRRRAGGRRRDPAGRALRPVPHPAVGGAGRAAPDPRQGPDRAGLRRPHVLGHRDLRAAGPHLHHARDGGGPTRVAEADDAHRRGAGPRAGPRGRGVPVAHDPGPRVVGLLAGQHRRLPHQRRHRGRRRPLPRRHPGRAVRAGSGRRPARQHRPAVAQPGPSRPQGRVPHRRRHRARRVHGHRRQQRVHEPDGPAEPAGRGGHRRPSPRPGRGAGRDHRGDGVVA